MEVRQEAEVNKPNKWSGAHVVRLNLSALLQKSHSSMKKRFLVLCKKKNMDERLVIIVKGVFFLKKKIFIRL